MLILQLQQFDHNPPALARVEFDVCLVLPHLPQWLWNSSSWGTKSDWLTRAQQTESSYNHLSRLSFTTLFGLLTRWMLKLNTVNSENLPGGVPGDFILFIYLFHYLFIFQIKTPLMCLGSFNQKVLCLILHRSQCKQNPDSRWWRWSGGGFFLRSYRGWIRRDPLHRTSGVKDEPRRRWWELSQGARVISSVD